MLSRSRTDLLQGQNKEKDNERVPLVCTWSSLLPPLQPLVNRALPLLQANDRLRGIFQRPVISFRRPRDLLVRTRSTTSSTSSKPTAAGSYPCRASRCKTCAVIHNITCIDLGPDCYVIRSHFDCTLENIIYLITCANPACTAAYVGETGRPLREHTGSLCVCQSND